MKRSIERLRVEYGSDALVEEKLKEDPIVQFENWLQEAIVAGLFEPNGMVLSTISPLGKPTSRTVLLKKFDAKGFIFFTDSRSRKGEHLEEKPFAALTFWWREIFRQICIEGEVKKISREEVRCYFNKRPRGAQIAVHASTQSSPLASRIELEETFQRLQVHFKGKPIPCPTYWCGYRLIPDRMEFWQGRANRLHDRIVYIKVNDEWIFSRLSP